MAELGEATVYAVTVGSAAGFKKGHTQACFSVEVEFHVEADSPEKAKIRLRALAGQRRLLDADGDLMIEGANLMEWRDTDLPGIYVHAIRLTGALKDGALRVHGPLGG